MPLRRQSLAVYGPTILFVLLWSSGAIVSQIGLQSATPFALLVLRFTLALAAFFVIGLGRRKLLPAAGTRGRVLAVGLALTAGYSIFYLQAMASGLTPGALAAILAVQPLLTLWITERRLSPRRMFGLLLAITGLVLVVWDGLVAARFSAAGALFAAAALACMTGGSLLQKQEAQAPMDVLPLQYAVGLAACLLLAPLQPIHVAPDAALLLSVLWLGLGISVAASLLLYRMIQAGDLVDVTSLFYLVPAGTALMDWAFLGNAMAPVSLVGLAVILAGLCLVFRRPA